MLVQTTPGPTVTLAVLVVMAARHADGGRGRAGGAGRGDDGGGDSAQSGARCVVAIMGAPACRRCGRGIEGPLSN